MDSAQALAVVRSLANGVDPESGEVFPPESVYQRPQIVRALYEAATALERIERFDRRKAQMPAKTGEPWSEVALADAGHEFSLQICHGAEDAPSACARTSNFNSLLSLPAHRQHLCRLARGERVQVPLPLVQRCQFLEPVLMAVVVAALHA